MSFRIAGTGMYVPENIVTNDDLSKLVETNDEWIRTRVGIERRHISVDETTADMAVKAAEAALENSGIKPEELDLILVSTVSGDYICPTVACLVQQALGVHCLAYDISAACSAFLFLLETAADAADPGAFFGDQGNFARGYAEQRSLHDRAEKRNGHRHGDADDKKSHIKPFNPVVVEKKSEFQKKNGSFQRRSGIGKR